MDFQTEDLKKIVKFQRMLILAVAVQLVLWIASFFLAFFGLDYILRVATGLFAAYSAYMLSSLQKNENQWTLIYAICSFVPIVSLWPAYMLWKKTEDALKAAGYNVELPDLLKKGVDIK